ncbi:Cox23p KNAG_0H03520 [Huiozyma naganishii CBS 8797]|uniref:Cytochrome c oxidase-assembly factor COX23, mitochondrial n=1 Tax=Huiozyma naganishii (strain ATCC MYA-139 / BCRC 22969 / CBS 8797 / KCTC 17520 / NBRC 10181 / NCYC 3082 / Yp74L-3) TaxID=1071383 RepID=J7S9X1_HUIN7|nr:hypothetical protein KNAG_0H03520 [Kazachstania naganishii CBS 8797]CCK71766.1 hypothetical protein KNAG_0H03520 [Kazachstania naganishii CBS 8797]
MSDGNGKGDTPAVEGVSGKETVDFAPLGGNPDEFRYFPDTPDSITHKYKFQTKGDSKFYDPCQESSKMSFTCLEQNDYDRSKCKAYFDAYRECKKQWLKARRANKSQWE